MKIKKVNKMKKIEIEKKLKKYFKFHDSKFYKHLQRALEKFD